MRISVGIHPSPRHPDKSVSDTGEGPKLVSKEFSPPEWKHLVKTFRVLGPVAAKKQLVTIQGVTLLHIQLGDFFGSAWFGVVPRLAMPMLISTAFIDRPIKGIFPE